MRGLCWWLIAISTGLGAAPAFASQNEGDMSDDCFAIAAPMADATPCFQTGPRKSHRHVRPNPNQSGTSAGTPIVHAGSAIRDAKAHSSDRS